MVFYDISMEGQVLFGDNNVGNHRGKTGKGYLAGALLCSA